MNVVSFELCKELYELSRWDNTPAGGKERWVALPDGSHDTLRLSDVIANGLNTKTWFDGIPAYGLGFLLRKLADNDVDLRHDSDNSEDGRWVASSPDGGTIGNIEFADTPENAVVTLAIELIKQGVLK